MICICPGRFIPTPAAVQMASLQPCGCQFNPFVLFLVDPGARDQTHLAFANCQLDSRTALPQKPPAMTCNSPPTHPTARGKDMLGRFSWVALLLPVPSVFNTDLWVLSSMILWRFIHASCQTPVRVVCWKEVWKEHGIAPKVSGQAGLPSQQTWRPQRSMPGPVPHHTSKHD